MKIRFMTNLSLLPHVLAKSIRRGWLLLPLLLILLAGCGGGETAEPPSVDLAGMSAPTPTPRPTATPLPTAGERTDGESAANAAGRNPLGSFLSDSAAADEPSGEESPPPAAANSETVPDTAANAARLEPVDITIDLQNGDLNTWLEISPPPGWRVVQGFDGVVLAQRPEEIPAEPFVLVRRWGNVVNLTDYLAYLPDAVEERNSNTAFRMGGYDWSGVFLTDEENSYRAFFGVSSDVVPSYTLLVYVPAIPNLDESDVTREQLLTSWNLAVGDLNSILRRLTFY